MDDRPMRPWIVRHGVAITKHAAQRGRKRMGLKRTALARKTADAIRYGERIADKKPTDPHRLRMLWAGEKFNNEVEGRETIHFDGFFYVLTCVTDPPILITVFADHLFMDTDSAD